MVGASFVAVGLLIRLAMAWGVSHSPPAPTGSRPSPSPEAGAVALRPGDYLPPRNLCERVDFAEFAELFHPQGVRDGYDTGLEPELVSGSMCEQSMARGGTGVVEVTVLCSAYRDVDKAVETFEVGLRAPYGPVETVAGLGEQALRYRASNGAGIGMTVLVRNLYCRVDATPAPPLTDAEVDGSFTAMRQLLQTLLPKLAA